MVNIIALLVLASFICLIAGLVKPTAFSRFIKGEITRKKIAIIFGISTVFFFVLFGVMSDGKLAKQANINQPQPSVAKEKQPKQQALSEKATEQKIETKTKEQPTQNKPIEVEKISATALHAAYERNAIEADEKYGGKILEVSGNISSIEKAYIISGMAIALNSKVLCKLKDSEKNKAVKLRKGQAVVVQGKHTRVSIVDTVLGNYILENCIIKKP